MTKVERLEEKKTPRGEQVPNTEGERRESMVRV